MKYFMIFAVAILILGMNGIVTAAPAGTNVVDMQCDGSNNFFYVSPNPFAENKEFWVCRLNTTNEYKCWTHVLLTDESQKLQTNPDRTQIDQVGIIDYFESSNGLVNVFFTPKNLKMDENFTFSVECIDNSSNWGQYKKNVTVEISSSEVYNIAPAFVWAAENVAFLIAISFAILFILAIGIYYMRLNK